MKKFLLGLIIGAAIASGVFYYIRLKEDNEQKEQLKALIESIKQGQATNLQTSETINDPNAALLIRSALTIIIGNGDEFYYYRNSDCSKIEKTNLPFISNLLKDEKARTKPDDLMIIIKSAEQSTYKSAIDLLDAINLANIPAGHFAQIDLSEKEKICIQQYKKN
jgi:hypothetical protein